MSAANVIAASSAVSRPTEAVSSPSPAYNVSIGYLRAFITLLVVMHHSVLAYHSYAPAPPTSLTALPRLWQAFPVVDGQRSSVWALLVGFNDIFFMALMFFVSGLFVWKSLQRKGSGSFLRDRIRRLGLPFVVAAAIVAPLAYYPTYLQSRAIGGAAGFWKQWLTLGNWPSGPAWFVWVLLAFDSIAALLFVFAPQWGDQLARLTSSSERRPIVLFAFLLAFSAAVYIPLAVIFNPFRWSAWGPFTFQTSRGLHYLIYFILGIVVGACGIERGLLAPGGRLARRWWLWSLAALFAFGVATVVGIAAITAHLGSRSWEIAGDSTFVLSCAASSFALLALFVRFARRRGKIWDSLTENTYGIYLVHYAFVSWLQLSLLRSNLPALAKGSIVTLAAILLSGGTTAVLRRIPAAARII